MSAVTQQCGSSEDLHVAFGLTRSVRPYDRRDDVRGYDPQFDGWQSEAIQDEVIFRLDTPFPYLFSGPAADPIYADRGELAVTVADAFFEATSNPGDVYGLAGWFRAQMLAGRYEAIRDPSPVGNSGLYEAEHPDVVPGLPLFRALCVGDTATLFEGRPSKGTRLAMVECDHVGFKHHPIAGARHEASAR